MNEQKTWWFAKFAFACAIVSSILIFLSVFDSFERFGIDLSHIIAEHLYGKYDYQGYQAINISNILYYITLGLSLGLPIISLLLAYILNKNDRVKRLSINAFAISFGFFIFFNIFLIPPCGSRVKARQSACLSNVKQLATALNLYADENDSKFPPVGSNWNKTIVDYSYNAKILKCPSAGFKNKPSYAINKSVAGISIKSLKNAKSTVLLFESRPGGNLFGAQELRSKYPRHSGGENIGFADGHASFVEQKNLLDTKMWIPKLR